MNLNLSSNLIRVLKASFDFQFKNEIKIENNANFNFCPNIKH